MNYDVQKVIQRIKGDYQKVLSMAVYGIKRTVTIVDGVVRPVAGTLLEYVYNKTNSEMQRLIADAKSPKVVVVTDRKSHWLSNYDKYIQKLSEQLGMNIDLRIFDHFNTKYKSAPYYVALSGNSRKNILPIKYSVVEVILDLNVDNIVKLQKYYKSYRKMHYFLKQMVSHGARIRQLIGQHNVGYVDVEYAIGLPTVDITNSIYLHSNYAELLTNGYTGKLYRGLYNSAMVRKMSYFLEMNNYDTSNFYLVDATKYSLFDIAQVNAKVESAKNRLNYQKQLDKPNAHKIDVIQQELQTSQAILDKLINKVQTIAPDPKDLMVLADEWMQREIIEDKVRLAEIVQSELKQYQVILQDKPVNSNVVNWYNAIEETISMINDYFDINVQNNDDELLLNYFDAIIHTDIDHSTLLKYQLPTYTALRYLEDLCALNMSPCFAGMAYKSMKYNSRVEAFGNQDYLDDVIDMEAVIEAQMLSEIDSEDFDGYEEMYQESYAVVTYEDGIDYYGTTVTDIDESIDYQTWLDSVYDGDEIDDVEHLPFAKRREYITIK